VVYRTAFGSGRPKNKAPGWTGVVVPYPERWWKGGPGPSTGVPGAAGRAPPQGEAGLFFTPPDFGFPPQGLARALVEQDEGRAENPWGRGNRPPLAALRHLFPTAWGGGPFGGFSINGPPRGGTGGHLIGRAGRGTRAQRAPRGIGDVGPWDGKGVLKVGIFHS